MDAILTALGLKLQVVVAGALGAFFSLRFFEGLTAAERWMTFGGGWALASYTSGIAHEYLELKGATSETGIALLIGLFGMSTAASFIKMIRETNWGELLKGRIGGPK